MSPDITMCVARNCPIRTKCYRYGATPSDRQSWADFSRKGMTKDCEHFMEYYGSKIVPLEAAK